MFFQVKPKCLRPVLWNSLWTETDLKFFVRWRGLLTSEDTLEPIQQIFEDFPILLKRLLKGNNTPCDLAQRACKLFGISKKGV